MIVLRMGGENGEKYTIKETYNKRSITMMRTSRIGDEKVEIAVAILAVNGFAGSTKNLAHREWSSLVQGTRPPKRSRLSALKITHT